MEQSASGMFFSDNEYKSWVKELKDRIRSSQLKAAVRVNASMLELYWSIGADIVNKQTESKWGNSVIEQLSRDLRSEFPDAQGFSRRNLFYMKRFFLFYAKNGANLVQKSVVRQAADQLVQQPVALIDFSVPEEQEESSVLVDINADFATLLLSAPWGHHIEIMTHCKSVEEAIFYLTKIVEEGWSRSTLIVNLKSDLYSRQGHAPNNFARSLPPSQGELASELLKDPYNFDFVALRDKYVERELEDALIDNASKLLVELGQGFAFLGRQVPVTVGDQELFIDLLFYQVNLHCYVVVELKAVDFDAAFMGQLGLYVAAVNHTMKTDADNPTIGLLICKTKNNVMAEWSLESSSQPIGISAYELTKLFPENFQSVLPSIEEIEAKLKG